MRKALMKGAGLFAVGLLPGGENAYHHLTRCLLGTQASHILKLFRVWPGYLKIIKECYGGSIEGMRVWVHESGWTPFLALANFMTTGNGGALINTRLTRARVLDRHLVESVNQVLDLRHRLEECTPILLERLTTIDGLRFCTNVNQLFKATTAHYSEDEDPGGIGLPDCSMDIMYCGGQLEHYPPDKLEAFLHEARRILRPGGFLSPVLDHRDHLFHFDHKIPFLYHYSFGDNLYRLTRSNRLLFHNRITPSDFADRLSAAGFEKIRFRRLTLPDNTWHEDGDKLKGNLGIPRHRLARRFRNISDDDLKTAAAHYLYRKPS